MKFSIFNFQFPSQRLVGLWPKISKYVLVFVIIVASFLRFYQLGHVPPSPDWDEAALGYNAYSILHTGRDEYGAFLPVVMRSFDDYKPALYSYLTIPTVATLGLNLIAVRLPSVLFGLLTIVLVYFLMDELFKRKDIALVTSLFLAISPWHIQFSRIAFESNVGLSLNVLGTFLFIKGLRKISLMPFAFVSFVASMYVYQSEKVFVPLFILLLIGVYWKEVVKLPRKLIALTVIVAILLSLPMGYYLLTNKNALARAKGVSVFSESGVISREVTRIPVDLSHKDYLGLIFDNRRIAFGKTVLANYLSHFDFNWLFITGDIARHHAPGVGLLYLFDLPFILIGVYFLAFGSYHRSTKILLFGWLLLAPIPASVTTGVPHAVRTLNFLPTFQLFSALGFLACFEFWKTHKNWLTTSIAVLVGCLMLFNISYYLDQYFVQQNYYDSQEWQYGYQEAVSFVQTVAPQYKRIIVSNQPPLDQSYMFFLFYLRYNPALYQLESRNASGGFRENHAFGKYEFRPIVWDKEEKSKDVLYVGRPSDFSPNANVLQKVSYLDGTSAIEVVKGQ